MKRRFNIFILLVISLLSCGFEDYYDNSPRIEVHASLEKEELNILLFMIGISILGFVIRKVFKRRCEPRKEYLGFVLDNNAEATKNVLDGIFDIFGGLAMLIPPFLISQFLISLYFSSKYNEYLIFFLTISIVFLIFNTYRTKNIGKYLKYEYILFVIIIIISSVSSLLVQDQKEVAIFFLVWMSLIIVPIIIILIFSKVKMKLIKKQINKNLIEKNIITEDEKLDEDDKIDMNQIKMIYNRIEERQLEDEEIDENKKGI